MHKSLFVLLLLLTSAFGFGFSTDEESTGVFGKLRSGLKLAGQLLGLDTASRVAKLVTESFAKPPQRKGESEHLGSNIFSGFFRLFGLESGKLGAIAVNAIVFLSQLISTSLSRPAPPEILHARKLRPGSPLDWITTDPNTKMSEFIQAAKDPELPDRIVEYLKERSNDEESGCVQLLVCKTAPFLWGMQKAVSSEKPVRYVTGTTGMFKHLPTLEEIADHGDECEKKFPSCLLY